MRARIGAACAAVVLVIGIARDARAQDEEATAPVSSQTMIPPGLFGPRPGPPVGASTSISHECTAGFITYPGTMAVTRQANTAWAIAGADPIYFRLELGSETSYYTFQDTREFVKGSRDLAETLWQVNAAPSVFAVFDPWTVYVGTSVIFAGNLDAPIDSALRVETDLALRYKVSDDFKLTFGFGVKTRIEAHPQFYPILGLEYGRFKLSVEGASVHASYMVVKNKLEIKVGTDVDYRDFRFEHDHNDQLDKAVMHDEDAKLGAGFVWTPHPGISFDVMGGSVAYRRILLDDSMGRVLAKARMNPSGYITMQITITI